MNRRDFLITTAATVSLPQMGSTLTAPRLLIAGAMTQQILPTKYSGHTGVLGFNGSVPGPELRVRQGQELAIRLQNNLNEGAAVHWHGIRLANAMDGVPALTQDLILPGGSFDYRFTAPDAGTYWYHSHYISYEQVARGLMGALVVEESDPPEVDHDICALLTDWKLDPDGQLTDDFGDTHDVAHAGRMGNFAKAFMPDIPLKEGDRLRLRLINASVDRIFPLNVMGLEGKVVALDGMPLGRPRDIGTPVIAPAQRMDIIADVTGEVALELQHRAGPYPLGSLVPSGQRMRRDMPIAALPANAVPQVSEPARQLTLRMMGGAMGGRHGGDNIWAFNDQSDMPANPFGSFRLGETAQISLVNDTRWPHAIHLHGHHFHELDAGGAIGDLRDTTLVNPGQTRDILCAFDNPGKWMLHCHMLSHQAGGMKTWVTVG